MSDSYRRTPIFGMTTCVSEKDDKVRAHRVERRSVKGALRAESDDTIPHPRAFGNPWSAGKDGKQYWSNAEAKDMRK